MAENKTVKYKVTDFRCDKIIAEGEAVLEANVATDILKGLSINTLSILYTVIIQIISINIGLGVFNLIPLPPLDGSKIFIRFMPYNVRNWIYDHEMWFYMAFLVLWFTDLSSMIISPIMNGIYSGIMNTVVFLLGLF